MAIYRNLITDDDGDFLEVTATGAMVTSDVTILGAKDPLNNGVCTLDVEHYEIHEGEHFFWQRYKAFTNAQVIDYVLTTGAKYPHVIYSIEAADAGFVLETYEGIAANADGTLHTLLNNNRPSEELPTATWREAPTGVNTTGATLIRTSSVGTGTTPSNRVAGSINRTNELIMKPNTKYLMRITNKSTSTNNINISLSFYEQ